MIKYKRKHILVISEVFAPEEFLINDLVFSWKKQGHLVSVLTRNPSYPEGKIYKGYKNRIFNKEIINDVTIYRVQFIPGYKNNRSIKILNYIWNMVLGIFYALIIGKKFDSVFIFQTGPLTFSTAGIILKKIYKKGVTIWSQDLWPETVHAYGLAQTGITKSILDSYVKWIYGNCDHITVSCPGFKPIISKYNPSNEITFIPQWSMIPKIERHFQISNEKLSGFFNFIFAGNIGKVQNLENVILGFNLFLNDTKKQDVWLNIIGDGSHLEFLKKIVINNNYQNIKFWGRVKSTDMPNLFNQADILLISLEDKPIFNLTIPAKFQAYLNAEKPILGILSGEVESLIKQYDLGWSAAPDDIKEISEIFKEIVSCRSEILQVKKKNTRILLEEQFNREKIIEKFTKLIFE
jgi:glycosyltransferase involved in cell wall biosynthesis